MLQIFLVNNCLVTKEKPLSGKIVNGVNAKERHVAKITPEYFEVRHAFLSANNFNKSWNKAFVK